MAYLFFQTWIWLLLAALFGFFIGWLVWGRRDAGGEKADAPIPARIEESEFRESEIHEPDVQEPDIPEPEIQEPEIQEPDFEEQVETEVEPARLDTPSAAVTTEAGPGGEQVTVPGIGPEDDQDTGRPELLESPDGAPDDLKRIRGVGPVLERTLNNLGIYHFRQIAEFTPANIAWVNAYLSFSGRIEREDWLGQARRLAGEETRDLSGDDEEEF